jgi:hypothetical protein
MSRVGVHDFVVLREIVTRSSPPGLDLCDTLHLRIKAPTPASAKPDMSNTSGNDTHTA